jgi:hypothetical protein
MDRMTLLEMNHVEIFQMRGQLVVSIDPLLHIGL